MSKYSSISHQRSTPPPIRPHPVWRGIGCILIVVVPLISYALAALTVGIAVKQRWPIPYQLLGHPVVPASLWKSQALAPLWAFIQAQNNLYAILVFAVLYIIVIGTILSVGYAVLYHFIGPPRYGPLDAPPPKIKAKRYNR